MGGRPSKVTNEGANAEVEGRRDAFFTRLVRERERGGDRRASGSTGHRRRGTTRARQDNEDFALMPSPALLENASDRNMQGGVGAVSIYVQIL